MSREFEIEQWQGESLYCELKKKFADQAAAYYVGKPGEVDRFITSLGVELFEFGNKRRYCDLNAAIDMKALIQAGFRDLVVEPEHIYLWHQTAMYRQLYPMGVAHGYGHLLKMFDGKSFQERYLQQKPFRQAWEEELINPVILDTAVLVEPADIDGSILRLIGQERLCLRAYLETTIGVSPATISRVVKRLCDNHLVSEKTISEGPGRPTGMLFLTETGRTELAKRGIQSAPADPDSEQAMAERIFHQRIAAAFIKAFPNSTIQRAYTNNQTPAVETPLGNIVPDLVVRTADEQVFFIEAESGKYDLKRLKEKMDKYLASRSEKVYVVTENKTGQTWNHLVSWINERKLIRVEGIPDRNDLQVWHTTQDLLQRHGPAGNIWRILTFLEERNRELQPISTTPHAAAQVSKLPLPLSTRSIEIVQRLRQIWPETPQSYIVNHFHMVHGCPVVLKGKEDEEFARLEADWIVYETDAYVDDPHELNWPFPAMYLNRVFFSYFLDPLWTIDRVRLAFDKMDDFLQAYVKNGEDPTEYTTLCPRDYPELYGMFVLVHTRPGEGNPATLSKQYASWRQVLRERMLAKYSYFPRVAVITLERLLQTKEPREVTDFAYDLMGYC